MKRKMVNREKFGVNVEPGNVKVLAVEKFYNDKDLCTKMGKTAREFGED